MRLQARLRKLEKASPPGQCPECRDRKGRIVMVTRGDPSSPADPVPCPRCGIVPEFVIEIVEVVVNNQDAAPTEDETTGL